MALQRAVRREEGRAVAAERRTRMANEPSGASSFEGRSLPPMDRWRLYLPRNLSFCSFCAEEVKKHIKKKTKRLDRFLKNKHPELCRTLVLDSWDSELEEETRKTRTRASSGEDSGVCFFLQSGDETEHNSLSSDDDSEDDRRRAITQEPFLITGEPHWLGPLTKKKEPRRSRSVVTYPERSVDSAQLSRKHRSPRGRRLVRFADSLGLELENVRYFIASDIPPVAATRHTTSHLHSSRLDFLRSKVFGSHCRLNKRLQTCSPPPPKSLPADAMIKLTLLDVDTQTSTISGHVSVRDIAFDKSVLVRCSMDAWRSFSDQTCDYLWQGGAPQSDVFGFTLFVPRSFPVGSRVDFAVGYDVEGTRYWDNNGGWNYGVEMLSSTRPGRTQFPPSPSRASMHDWLHVL